MNKLDIWLTVAMLLFVFAVLFGSFLPLIMGFNVLSIVLVVIGSVVSMGGFCYAIGKSMGNY
jgi:hypothetical protein